MSDSQSTFARVLAIASLIIAAEAIFTLPYHVARFFRPTLLLALGIDNTQLGLVQSAYGIVAMLAYFPGGPLADRFSARRLLTASLVTTAAGGLYFATLPPVEGLWVLFAFWGLTTILLFWAALIRATREWGDPQRQGEAYGLLDAGRGLLAAAMAALAVAFFADFLPEDPADLTNADRRAALRSVIFFYSAVTLGAALLTWFFVKEVDDSRGLSERAAFPWARIRSVFRMRVVWLQALIVICAYVGYKGIDYYALFAVDVYAMSEVEGARLSAMTAWIRPVAAMGAGLLADRIFSSRATGLLFALVAIGYGVPLVTEIGSATMTVFFLNVVVTSVAVYGLRGVYFALLEEGAVPAVVTGTAVGLVSVLGYSPDVFFGVLAGWLIDSYPGAPGYRYFCFGMIGFAAVGIVASLFFARAANSALSNRGASA
ncbi:MAG: MFS transporter [Myxococcota bacterium]|nr:MFS transporter [Myxococcota bacterium]